MLSTVRDVPALRDEVVAMREKLRAAHACPPEEFDLKHSPGGMIDVEFTVQFLVLAHSHRTPALLGNLGNIALLQIAEDAGLLPSGVGRAAGDAYRTLRRLQHRARLSEAPTRLGLALATVELQQLRRDVLKLWQHVLGEQAS